MTDIGVIVADDDPLVLELVSEVLSEAGGLRCLGVAEDGLGAVSLAARHRPQVALLDVRMPSGGGAAVRAIHEVSPHTVVIAFSSHEQESLILDMLNSGAQGYLLKGTPGFDLVAAIRAAVEGETVLSPPATATVVDHLRSLSTRIQDLVDRTDRLEVAKEEFIQILAHELLTPTTVMQASADTVGRFAGETDVAILRELADRTAGAAQRLRRIVDNLSLAAHLRDGGRQPRLTATGVRELVADAAADVGLADARLRLLDGDERVTVRTDPRLVSHALGLVLENAAEHGDRVEVEVTTEDGIVTVAVRDDGPGFPEGYASGEPFQQADSSTTRPRGGLGIGLYLTQLIMQRLGGEVVTGAAADGGAEVRLVLRDGDVRD